MGREDYIVAAVIVLFVVVAFGVIAFGTWNDAVTKRACIEAGHDPLICKEL